MPSITLMKELIPSQREIPLLREHPSGMRVELIDFMGNDLRIVNAARVSLLKESKYEWWYEDSEGLLRPYPSPERSYPPPIIGPQLFPMLSVSDDGLLGFLMRERHGTPFEKVVFEFRVKAPIGVVWEWVRHRIASYNVASTRYVEWDKDYYTPEAEDWRTQVGKVGHYKFETINDGSQMHISAQYELAMEQAFNHYGILLKMGLAKEVARNVLPMGAMTEFMWTINARSLMNFLSLRNEEHALREIQICARMVEELAGLVIPVTLEKWNEQERRAP